MPKEGKMATYVTLYRFTEQGARNIQDSPKRVDRIRQMFKEHGCEIREFYALMGQFDTMIVATAPNDEAILRLNLAIDAMGNVTSQTMRAFDEKEFRAMVQAIQPMMAKAA